MKKIIISILCLFVFSAAAFGVYRVFNPSVGTVTILYNVKKDGVIYATKNRIQEQKGNFSEETVYLGATSAEDRIHNLVGIVGNGVYDVKHETAELVFNDGFAQHLPPDPAELQNNNPNFHGTTTILGYEVLILGSAETGLVSYYSPVLKADLKYDDTNGNVIEATEIQTNVAQSVVLPSYKVGSYDPYKVYIDQLVANNAITQEEATQMRSVIPEPFRSAAVSTDYCDY